MSKTKKGIRLIKKNASKGDYTFIGHTILTHLRDTKNGSENNVNKAEKKLMKEL